MPALQDILKWSHHSPAWQLAAALLVLFLAAYSTLILARNSPFVYDEGWLSLSIKEFCANPSIVVPTVAGEHLELKPPLFIWVYSGFHILLAWLPLPAESVFRLPSALFGAINASLVFLIADRMYGRRAGIASALLFATAYISVFSATTAMMESFSLFLALAAIWSYVDGRLGYGMAFLGMLVMVKWLYVGAPVLFIALHFLRDRRLPHVLLSFASIPAALGIYLLLAFAFGSLDNALGNLALDISRPVPVSMAGTMNNFVVVFLTTFPMSVLVILLGFFCRFDAWKERDVIALCLLAFVIPFSGYFIFWYLTLTIPAFAIFLSRRLEELDHRALFALVLLGLICMNMLMNALAMGPFQPSSEDAKAIFISMKGKDAYFVEPLLPGVGWLPINEKYGGTSKSFLLLDQFNTGFLFYRFDDRSDYGNVHAVFLAYNETAQCADYMVVHLPDYASSEYNWSAPPCMRFLRAEGNYAVFGPVGASDAMPSK